MIKHHLPLFSLLNLAQGVHANKTNIIIHNSVSLVITLSSSTHSPPSFVSLPVALLSSWSISATSHTCTTIIQHHLTWLSDSWPLTESILSVITNTVFEDSLQCILLVLWPQLTDCVFVLLRVLWPQILFIPQAAPGCPMIGAGGGNKKIFTNKYLVTARVPSCIFSLLSHHSSSIIQLWTERNHPYTIVSPCGPSGTWDHDEACKLTLETPWNLNAHMHFVI